MSGFSAPVNHAFLRSQVESIQYMDRLPPEDVIKELVISPLSAKFVVHVYKDEENERGAGNVTRLDCIRQSIGLKMRPSTARQPSESDKLLSEERSWGVLYPLACPKLTRPSCEMCSKPATRFCSQCRVTYYCSADHYYIDDNHPTVCTLVGFLRAKNQICSTMSERARMAKLQKIKRQAVVDKIVWIGVRYMLLEDYARASLVYYQAINYAKNLFFGLEHSMVLTRIYLYRVECALKLHNLHLAKFNMGLAEHCVMQHQELQDNLEFIGHFYRMEGLINFAKKDYDDALFFMAESIYYHSKIDGPDGRETARSFYHMGEIFDAIGKHTIAIEYYSHALRNYTDWIVKIFKENWPEDYKKTILAVGVPVKDITLPMLMQGDAIIRLKRLLEVFDGEEGIQYGQILACLGILVFFSGHYETCESFLSTALDCLRGVTERDIEWALVNSTKQVRKLAQRYQATVTQNEQPKKTKMEAETEKRPQKNHSL